MRLVQAGGAVFQHLDQARFVQYGVGVGRAYQAGDAAVHRRQHLGFERGLVFVAGLAQARRQIDQTGRDDQVGCVDHALGGEAHPDVLFRQFGMQARVESAHRHGAHHLHAAGDDDVVHSAQDGLRAERDALQAAGAEAVDGHRAHVDGESRLEHAQARDVEALASLGHRAAPDDVVDVLGIELHLVDDGLEHRGREVDGMHARQCAILLSTSDGRADGAHDHDFVLHMISV